MKLTKSQLIEFSKSAISSTYANINFKNVNKRQAKSLISESIFKAYHIAPSGWSDNNFTFIKPVSPRTKNGKTVKYENVNGSPKLIEVVHPSGTVLKPGINFVEGLKKAVAVAELTQQQTFHFPGLGGGIALADAMLAISAQATLFIDNDLSASAQQNARALLSKVPTYKVASFIGYKGIDDLLANAVTYTVVNSQDWLNSYAGYTGTTNFINLKYLPATINYPAKTQLLNLISPKGSGKTTLMRGIAQAKMLQGCPAIYVSHRIALGRDAAKRLAIPYLDKDSEMATTSAALCVDSIRSIAITPALNGSVLYLDELTQLWNHLLTSDTLNGKRGEVFAHFVNVVKYITENGGIVVAADADLDELHISYLADIIGNKQNIFSVYNNYVQQNGQAIFYTGAKGATKTVRGFDVIDQLIADVHAGKKCYISLSGTDATSLCGTKNLADYLSTFTDSLIEINAENSGNPDHVAYKAVEKINLIVDTYQVILASPTLGTGVDITAKVDAVYCLHSGLNSVNDVSQSLARVRDFSVTRHIYVPEVHAMNNGYETKFTDVNSIVNYCQSAISSNPYAHLSRNATSILCYELSNKFLAATNKKIKNEQANYRHLLQQKLMSEGYIVSVVDSNETVFPEHELALEEFRTANVSIADELIINAPLIDETTYQELISKKSVSPEDNAKIEKFNFFRNNGVEINAEILALKKDNYFVNAKRGYLAENFEIAETLTERALSFETSKNYVSSDLIRIKSRFEAIQAYKNSGLDKLATIKPSEIDSLKVEIISTTDLFGSTVDSVSIPVILKSFGKIVTSSRMRDGNIRRVGYDVADDTSTLYKQLKEFWLAKDILRVESFKEYKATQSQRVIASQQDSGIILKGQPLDMTYTNLSTRSRAIVGSVKPCEYRLADASNLTEVKSFITTVKHVAIDVETAANDITNKMGGLDYTEGHIELLQMCDGVTTWLVTKEYLTAIYDEMCIMLSSREVHKFGHNFSFDCRFLRATFDTKIRNIGCSLIAAKCLLGDYGAAKIISYSLKSVVENFLGATLDKTEQKSDWSQPLTNSQLQYAANDAYYTYLVYQQLGQLLVKPSILGLNIPDNICAEMYNLESTFLNVQQSIEETGYQIDQAAVDKCIAERTTKLVVLLAEWDNLMPGVTPNQVQVICRTLSARYDTDINSVSRKAIYTIDIPEIKIRKQIDAINRDLDLLNTINGESSVKPVITSLTGTGRTSVGNRKVNKKFLALHGIAARTNPAIPKDWNFTSVRSCFKVGQIIDLPASHAHISANLSGDKAALAALSDESIDNHCVVAVSVAKAIGLDTDLYTADYIKSNKKSGICKQLRDTAKNTFYGWLNGAGIQTVKLQIQANLGLSVTSDAAAIALNGLKNLFNGITEYSQAQIQELRENISIVNGQLVGHMIVNNQLISWVVGKTGDSPNPSPTKATGAIWSRIEATLTKRAGIRILDSIELEGLHGSLLGYNHDDFNLDGSDEFKQSCFNIMRDEFVKAATLTGFSAFGGYAATTIDASGTPITRWSQK
jgi:hypothetical protein